ncbi:hypothetical protein B0H12DRAFT_361040 [Mycena haematopus]|nr:hypothetical protein B0H12DRAFT_361040 [Mycena haematopus]
MTLEGFSPVILSPNLIQSVNLVQFRPWLGLAVCTTSLTELLNPVTPIILLSFNSINISGLGPFGSRWDMRVFFRHTSHQNNRRLTSSLDIALPSLLPVLMIGTPFTSHTKDTFLPKWRSRLNGIVFIGGRSHSHSDLLLSSALVSIADP